MRGGGYIFAALVIMGFTASTEVNSMEGFSVPAHAFSAMTAKDPFAWLEERHGKRAMAWVQGQNRRTLDHFKSDPRYKDFYDTVLSLRANGNSLPSAANPAWIHDGWMYDVQRGVIHPRGILRRVTLGSLRTAAPAWEDLLDIDALSRQEGKNYTLIHGACFGSRCLLLLEDEQLDGKWREFDVGNRIFVNNGFVIDTSVAQLPVWKNWNTLILGERSVEDGRSEQTYVWRVKE